MQRMLRFIRYRGRASRIATTAALLCGVLALCAQDTPLISGGAGFITNTNGGNTTYIPVISPLLAAPLGNHFLIESRATVAESFFPRGDDQAGYSSSLFAGLSYLQLDYLATPHLTVVGGEFLTPFATYNERLTPIWISNFASAPLIFPLGIGTGSSVGGMLRGSAFSNENVSVSYAGYFSALSTNPQFNAQRASGGRVQVYFPRARLEVGSSYGRSLQNQHQNFIGTDLWWQPADALVKIRSEYAHGEHSQGYWIESEFHIVPASSSSEFRRGFTPVFRWQQTFRNSPYPSDGLPPVNTNQADFGLDYLFPHEVRINTSYSRQFASTGDRNIWQTGIVYRFLFPTWKGR